MLKNFEWYRRAIRSKGHQIFRNHDHTLPLLPVDSKAPSVLRRRRRSYPAPGYSHWQLHCTLVSGHGRHWLHNTVHSFLRTPHISRFLDLHDSVYCKSCRDSFADQPNTIACTGRHRYYRLEGAWGQLFAQKASNRNKNKNHPPNPDNFSTNDSSEIKWAAALLLN